MKKNTNENRPDFALMKLSGAISYFHMQMPRWLFCDPHYTDMSLEAKVAYTFLLNRYQLSRRNGWVNRHGEVYIIYTREDLAREMQVSYRKAISCFKELADRKLVWEQRQGRGLPNRIFLAEVELDEKSCYTYEALFQKELSETDAEFGSLQLYSQELQVRVDGIRMMKAA